MTFESWLLKQIKRDDPIGDLAKDFKMAKNPHEKCNEIHLSKWDACENAYIALKEAFKEYKKEIK